MLTIKLLPNPIQENKEIPHKNKKNQKRKTNISDEIYLETTISWYLSTGISFLKDEFELFNMEIQYSEPSIKLTDEITNENILELLNLNLLFEFEYVPQNGDLFVLRIHYVYEHEIKNRNRPYLNKFLSFIYNNNIWNIDYYKARINSENSFEGIVEIQ